MYSKREQMLSFYDTDKSDFIVEPGKFKIHIGSASNDIKLIAEFDYRDAD